MTAQQEIAPEARKAFHSRLLMSLNTESEQEPKNSSILHPNYQVVNTGKKDGSRRKGGSAPSVKGQERIDGVQG
jgi:hypothetical protein